MRIILDTTVFVDIERKNKAAINLCKTCAKNNISMVISTVTVSEILTGSYSLPDFEKKVLNAKQVLMQFTWIDLDGDVAEETAKLLSYQISKGIPTEYQDTVIAASFKVAQCDYLITTNKSHFAYPFLEDKVFKPIEFLRKILK